jgi:2-C-methyl-D-erythritol 4-phosphate cytidylyltransferase
MPDMPAVPRELWAIVVAAGSGSRFGGDTPKQELALGDCRVMDWSIRQLSTWCDGVVLVVRPDAMEDETHRNGAATVVAGGSTRSQSVRNGLDAVPSRATVVLVHDAARPFIPQTVFHALIGAIDSGADAAIPGIAVTDTIKRVAGGMVVDTPPRNELVAVQTPQAFRAAVLRQVHASGGEATDDAALVESVGGRVAVVAGSDDLRKVTTADDLAWLRGRLPSWQ